MQSLKTLFRVASQLTETLPLRSILIDNSPALNRWSTYAFNALYALDINRRFSQPKIFLRHDIMRNILTRFLDSKGVPTAAVDRVVETEHYYALPKDQFDEFERVVTWLGTIGVHSGVDLGRILIHVPVFLWLDINLCESKIQWFMRTFFLQRHEIGPLLVKNPNLLFHHVETMNYFLQLLEFAGIKFYDLRRMIQKDPKIMERCQDMEEIQVTCSLRFLLRDVCSVF